MDVQSLAPDLRLRLSRAVETLVDLLEEETGRLPHLDAEQAGLYAKAKEHLFWQIEAVLEDRRRRPPPSTDDGAEAGTEDDPVEPDALPVLLARLKTAVAANLRALEAARAAVASVSRHLATAVERTGGDGVYGRHGPRGPTRELAFARVEHRL